MNIDTKARRSAFLLFPKSDQFAALLVAGCGSLERNTGIEDQPFLSFPERTAFSAALLVAGCGSLQRNIGIDNQPFLSLPERNQPCL